jgi:cytoskeletal protein CcmA (bactofilin family)
MVFGSKRDTKPDSLSREDVVGNLYPDSLTSEVDVAQPATTEFPRTSDRGNESVIDPHARFNGKYVSDRDLRIEGEAQGEIECQGTLIISPQARVRSAIKAHNVIVSGDYEGDVDCGGRFEIGSTGRVKGNIKTQVLVVKEGAHWEGGVTMTREPGARPAPGQPSEQGAPQRSGGNAPEGQSGQGGQSGQPAQGATGGPGGSIFGKGEREGQPSGAPREGQPARQGSGQ